MFVCLLDELILGFCYSDLTLETGGFELASTITLALQANRLTKCASLIACYPKNVLGVFLVIIISYHLISIYNVQTIRKETKKTKKTKILTKYWEALLNSWSFARTVLSPDEARLQ